LSILAYLINFTVFFFPAENSTRTNRTLTRRLAILRYVHMLLAFPCRLVSSPSSCVLQPPCCFPLPFLRPPFLIHNSKYVYVYMYVYCHNTIPTVWLAKAFSIPVAFSSSIASFVFTTFFFFFWRHGLVTIFWPLTTNRHGCFRPNYHNIA
jgi:hypothetical protein